MMASGNDDFDDFDLPDSDDDMEFVSKHDSRKPRNFRRELDRRMEMKSLRDMLDEDYDMDDWD
jgi:hypothetical protein